MGISYDIAMSADHHLNVKRYDFNTRSIGVRDAGGGGGGGGADTMMYIYIRIRIVSWD